MKVNYYKEIEGLLESIDNTETGNDLCVDIVVLECHKDIYFIFNETKLHLSLDYNDNEYLLCQFRNDIEEWVIVKDIIAVRLNLEDYIENNY